jgi:hypothetical protein
MNGQLTCVAVARTGIGEPVKCSARSCAFTPIPRRVNRPTLKPEKSFGTRRVRIFFHPKPPAAQKLSVCSGEGAARVRWRKHMTSTWDEEKVARHVNKNGLSVKVSHRGRSELP